MNDPNSGSDPYVRVFAYVEGGTQTYVLFQYKLIAWQTSYGYNTGTGIDSVDIEDLTLLDGEYLHIRFEGNSVSGSAVSAVASCSYEVQ